MSSTGFGLTASQLQTLSAEEPGMCVNLKGGNQHLGSRYQFGHVEAASFIAHCTAPEEILEV